jgi:amino acid transporter
MDQSPNGNEGVRDTPAPGREGAQGERATAGEGEKATGDTAAQRPSGGRTVKIVSEESRSPQTGGLPAIPSSTPSPEPEVRQIPRPTTSEHKVRPDLRREEVVKGSHPGDTFIRYTRRAGPFRRLRQNVLSASLDTEAPRSPVGRFFAPIKRVLIGQPISTEHAMHERLTNIKALAVLSSDALSSVAYATEEILLILILAGVGALSYGLPLGIAVIVLMIIVVASYRQTIAAYPRGGGTYIVAKDNLGTMPGLIAAASILLGYILTVAVSVAAGVAAIYSLFPDLRPYRVEIAIGIVVFVTIANLRGLREAGNIFAVPTYLFIFGIFGLIGYGLLRVLLGVNGFPEYNPPAEVFDPGTLQDLSIILLLRAFTQGSAALTGVEAIADGVPAFKPPEARNARKTLVMMAVISIIMFGGITYLATQLQILPSEQETVVSQLARTIFGENALWYFIQIATALILVLAANTAFADFPRLSYFLARDKFMPHQYSFRGDKLAYSWGIVTLAVLACLLVVIFNGDTSALIPLYAIGVMSAFTFSQGGMVVRWWRTRPPGWWRNLIMNAVGALTTAMVFVVATFTKLEQGTWIFLVLVPVLIAMFLAINRHYTRISSEVALVAPVQVDFKHTFIVPVGSLNAVSLSALSYARSLSDNVTAVHIVEGEDPEEAESFNEQWQKLLPGTDIQVVIIESPYRSLIGPLLSYIDALDQQNPDDTVTIVLAESLPAKPWEYLLHNQSALRLKASLLFRPNTVVVDVPYLLGRGRGGMVGRKQLWTLGRFPWGLAAMLAALVAILYFVLVKP